jgi:biopolymer transport protein ExbD
MESGEGKPNLTPLLDMVFQLITFFMLVINFKSQTLDLSLKLPVVGSARPVDTKGLQELVVLNVDAGGNLKVYGQVKDVKRYIEQEAQQSLFSARMSNPELQHGDELPTTIVVRADRATPFHLLNNVITTCQQNGFRKFALKAMNKRE